MSKYRNCNITHSIDSNIKVVGVECFIINPKSKTKNKQGSFRPGYKGVNKN